MNKLALRDHAGDLLRSVAQDMGEHQSDEAQHLKAEGHGTLEKAAGGIDAVSKLHAIGRAVSGFDLPEVISEYRALRASVLRLWRARVEGLTREDLEDVTRFNEAIDQSLSESVRSYTKRVNESSDLFLAILGHDLRAPLTTVMMSAELMANSARADSEMEESAALILRSAERMSGLINDLLVFTNSRRGVVMPIEVATTSLAEVCEQGIEEVIAANPGAKIELECEDRPVGKWDRARIAQAVSNLLNNAVHYGAKGAAVRVRVKTDDKCGCVAVMNEGVPIREELLRTLFDPFVRGLHADDQQYRRPGSVGLGLHIVREIATAHGGRVWVASSEAEGTVFHFCLPVEG